MAQAGPGRMGAFVGGIVLGVVLPVLGGLLYFKFGNLPVAVADKPFPFEKQIVHVPLNARIDREMEKPPMAPGDAVFAAGAQVYAGSCASCHGVPGKDVPFAGAMYPTAPQLWKKHRRGNVVGVSDDEPGETYWKVKNGIRLTGMPAFGHILSEVQMWQVSLLLANADKPMSPAVLTTLAGGVSPTAPPAAPGHEQDMH